MIIDLDIDGYKDWFLPSQGELNLMYMNLKEKNVGKFKNAIYWSSSEGSHNGYAWAQNFENGRQYGDISSGYNDRNANKCVRAVRAF